MRQKIEDIRNSINKNISALIKEEFKYANYAISLKNRNISFTEVLAKMKELKHSLMKLDKELVELE